MPDPTLTERVRDFWAQFEPAPGTFGPRITNQDIELPNSQPSLGAVKPPTALEQLLRTITDPTWKLREKVREYTGTPDDQWAPVDLLGLIGLNPDVPDAPSGHLAAAPAARTLATLGEETAAKVPLKAFHGSPHDFPAERLIQLPGGQQAYQLASEALPQGASVVKEFPLGRFRGDKIGTGEGGQAYSYGHYAAQKKEVSQDYRDKLAFLNDEESAQVRDTLPEMFRGPDNVRNITRDIREAVSRGEIEKPSHYMRDYDVAPPLRRAYQKAGEILDNKGKMYELNLHTSPEHLLDWDTALSRMPAPVQEKVKSLLTPDVLKQMKPTPLFTNLTGADIYEGLVKSAGGRAGHTEGIASQQLADAGIHGVQYLDQGSRGIDTPEVQGIISQFGSREKALAGMEARLKSNTDPERGKILTGMIDKLRQSQTRNYVIFPHFEHLIEISKKYGVTLAVAAEMYRRATQPQMGDIGQ